MYKRKLPQSGPRAKKIRASKFPSLAAMRAAGGTRYTYRTVPRALPMRYGGYRTPAGRLERKFVDTAVATYEMDTTGSVALIATVPQGAGESQRIGREINLHSLQIHGTVQAKTTTTLAAGRFLVVWDKQPNAALAAITDILNTANYYSFLNDQNKKRFKILMNRPFTFSGNSTTPASGNEVQVIDDYIKLKRRQTTYGTVGTGAIGDIKTGALLFVVAGNTAAGTAACTAVCGFRTRFIDP